MLVSVKQGAFELTTSGCLARCALPPGASSNIVTGMKFHKIWVQQCRATRRIKRRFGAESALDYLLGEKLLIFAETADQRPEFAAELPRFSGRGVERLQPIELAGYLTTLKPPRRKKLQKLLYVSRCSSSHQAS